MLKSKPDNLWKLNTDSLPDALKRRLEQIEVYPQSEIDQYNNTSTTPKAWAREITKEKAWLYIVDGFGMGEYVKELYETICGDPSAIVIMEPDLRLLRTAFKTKELLSLLASPSVQILTSRSRVQVAEQLAMFGDRITREIKVCPLPFAPRHTAWKNDVLRIITEIADGARTGITTQLVNSEVTCKNLLGNAKRYWANRGLNDLKDHYKDQPAILVAAGPSLEDQFDLLLEYKNNAVFIVVPTVLKTFFRRGFHPQFVTSLDYHSKSARFLDGLTAGQTELIAEPKVNPAVLESWNGPLRLLSSEWLASLMPGFRLDHDPLPCGATVAHLSFYFAQYLGCSPIILVGHDLAFTPGTDGEPRYYPDFIFEDHPWKEECRNRADPQRYPLSIISNIKSKNRKTQEEKEFDKFIRCKKKTDPGIAWDVYLSTITKSILPNSAVPSKGEVYTDEQMTTYLHHFEAVWEACDNAIDCTGGGAYREGIKRRKLSTVLKKYCSKPMDIKKPILPDNARSLMRKENFSGLGQSFTEVTYYCDLLKGYCEKMIVLENALAGNVTDETVVRFNEDKKLIVASLASLQKYWAILNTWSGRVSILIHRMDSQRVLLKLTAKAKYRAQFKRDQIVMKGMIEAAAELKEALLVVVKTCK